MFIIGKVSEKNLNSLPTRREKCAHVRKKERTLGRFALFILSGRFVSAVGIYFTITFFEVCLPLTL